MFNDFENDPSEDMRFSVERYEEMIRNKDLYFFDTEAFYNIIDYYHNKNDPIKALQVIDYAISQHPYAAMFLIKHVQLFLLTSQIEKARELLERAQSMEPSNPDIYMIRGSIFEREEQPEKALESYEKALSLANESEEIYLQIAYVYQGLGKFDKAIE